MDELLKEVLNYLENATQEQLDKDWEKLEPYSHIGPTVDEFLGMECNKQILNKTNMNNLRVGDKVVCVTMTGTGIVEEGTIEYIKKCTDGCKSFNISSKIRTEVYYAKHDWGYGEAPSFTNGPEQVFGTSLSDLKINYINSKLERMNKFSDDIKFMNKVTKL